ncbi:MAG: molybdopterin-binding protein [Rhodospirillales bacterium]|nr:molybdopterin-binding protein [Rhodospirillales bacterium]
MPDKTVTACLLIIGNEILSGRTRDANLAFLGDNLNRLGIRLTEARVIPDEAEVIVATINDVRARFDYVFTTGGIGPTHDDITAECVARAFGLPLIQNPEARAILEAHYPPGDLNEARLRMANTPEGATLIENPISRAPGFQIGNVFVLAGIPSVMQAMFASSSHRLTGGKRLLSASVTAALPEGLMAAGLKAIQKRYPEVEIGSYPFHRMGVYGARLVLRSVDEARLAAARAEVRELVEQLAKDAKNA